MLHINLQQKLPEMGALHRNQLFVCKNKYELVHTYFAPENQSRKQKQTNKQTKNGL